MKPLIFCFPNDAAQANQLAGLLGAEMGTLDWHRFPDGESLITLHGECAGREVIAFCTLNDPDAKALPLYFLAATARDLGARRVGLIAPYLAYLRQDVRFRSGQALSARAFAHYLSGSFDWLITIDPHLHRLASLDEVFTIPAAAISSMPAVSGWIRAHVENPILIGPDSESAQWTEQAAHALGAKWVVLEKTRAGDRQVTVSAPDPAVICSGTPVIVDDIASSGHTLAEVLRRLTALGAAPATCIVVHALFAEGAERAINEAGAERIVSTNTVPHRTNAIDVAPLLAQAIKLQLEQ